jgi:Dimerisation domain
MVISASQQPPTLERVFRALNAYEQTEAMKAAIGLEIFTAIAEGNTSAAAIAKRCQAGERGVEILRNYLTIHGFLTKEGRSTVSCRTQHFFLAKVRGHTLGHY